MNKSKLNTFLSIIFVYFFTAVPTFALTVEKFITLDLTDDNEELVSRKISIPEEFKNVYQMDLLYELEDETISDLSVSLEHRTHSLLDSVSGRDSETEGYFCTYHASWAITGGSWNLFDISNNQSVRSGFLDPKAELSFKYEYELPDVFTGCMRPDELIAQEVRFIGHDYNALGRNTDIYLREYVNDGDEWLSLNFSRSLRDFSAQLVESSESEYRFDALDYIGGSVYEIHINNSESRYTTEFVTVESVYANILEDRKDE